MFAFEKYYCDLETRLGSHSESRDVTLFNRSYKIKHNFIFTFCSNFGASLYRFSGIA